MAKQKGVGCGGCCCGGCWSPPSDGRASTTADIQEIQQYCCKCIPKFVCVAVSGGTYDDSQTLLSRTCGNSYDGPAIQFAGQISWDGASVGMKIRLQVVDGVCSLLWEIDDLELSGTREINHSEQASEYGCQSGMRTDACVNFGGTWEDLDGGHSLTISAPATFDIASNIDCAGCKCMCDCICMSIYSRTSGGLFTLVGANEIVCSTVTEATFENCDASKTETLKTVGWSFDGWDLSLAGGTDYPPVSYTVLSGMDHIDCDLDKVLRFSDSQEHRIEASGGSSDIYYEFHTSHDPLSLKWLGRSVDETSTTTFYLWNWDDTTWDVIGTKDGRAVGVTVNRFFKSNIAADYIKLDAGVNKVRLRVETDGTDLYTDLCRMISTRCCEIVLTPKDGITPTTTLAKVNLSTEGNCPSPSGSWTFTDQDDTEWVVGFSCSWCGGNCGTVYTGCCPRPISEILVAEVNIDCPSCTEPFTVILTHSGGGIWDGEGVHCNLPFYLTFSCTGSGWHVNASGAGACSFAGDAASADCDPFYIAFGGAFGGGIGCCGVGSMDTTAGISIVVFE